MKHLHRIASVGLIIIAASCASTMPATLNEAEKASVKVLTPDQVTYILLNPARGDSSSQAGVLWGDIRNDQASGVLLRFADGFSSPPHIHNITYRGVVISGELHNDDPDAAKQWMGTGSFWTQPAGENHITAARPGRGATAFLEILSGPYLVQPPAEQFDNGERPINLQSSNIVWMGAEDFNWISASAATEGGAEVALLWGELDPGSPSGAFVKLPANFSGSILTNGGDLKAVVVEGDLVHSVAAVTDEQTIGAGGYFESAEGISHTLTCEPDQDCIIYVRSNGKFEVR